MFENIKDMGKMLKQAKELKEKMQTIQQDLKKVTVSGEAGEGRIKITITGELEPVEVKIDPAILKPENSKKLEQGIMQAMGQAIQKAKNEATSRISSVTGGMSLPEANN